MTQNFAVLFGHADDTLVAWQHACVQATEALRLQRRVVYANRAVNSN